MANGFVLVTSGARAPWAERLQDDPQAEQDETGRDRPPPARTRETLVGEQDPDGREEEDDRREQGDHAPQGGKTIEPDVAARTHDDRGRPRQEGAHQQERTGHEQRPDPVAGLLPQDRHSDGEGGPAEDGDRADEGEEVEPVEPLQLVDLERQDERKRRHDDPENHGPDEEDRAGSSIRLRSQPQAEAGRPQRSPDRRVEVARDRGDVDLVAQSLRERGARQVGVEAGAIESMVDRPLEAPPERLEECRDDKGRECHGDRVAAEDRPERTLQQEDRARRRSRPARR